MKNIWTNLWATVIILGLVGLALLHARNEYHITWTDLSLYGLLVVAGVAFVNPDLLKHLAHHIKLKWFDGSSDEPPVA